MGNQKKFLITVNDMMFGNFKGEFIEDNEEQAIEDAIEYYANAFDTEKYEINVIDTKEVF